MQNKTIEPRTLPGFRDFLPETLRVRKKVISIFSEIFERFGFEPLETPALEYQDILLGKYGEEAEKLMYLFKDQGQRGVGLRYDLTVPTSRVLAKYQNLPKPFKRYQIQNVWRAEKPQKGRYREFTQCDIDSFGSRSPISDAEILTAIFECLKSTGFTSFKINLNSREILFSVMENAGIPKEKYSYAIQSIDKLDKKTEAQVKAELADKDFDKSTVESIFSSLKSIKPNKNLVDIMDFAIKLGLPSDFLNFSPYLSRGLDYYTGAIFETTVTEPKIGSVTGGGRYDNLISTFTGNDVPAVGTSFGLDRIVDVISELNLWPDFKNSPSTVLVTVFSPDLLDQTIEIANTLRNEKISTELFLDFDSKLEKQLKYADQKKIPYAIILGPEEVNKGLVTVKNLVSKEQKTIPAENLTDEFK